MTQLQLDRRGKQRPKRGKHMHSTITTIDQMLGWVEAVLMLVACAAVVIMMLAIAADGTGRYVLNQPITGIREVVTEYLMIATVWLAFSFTQRMRGHVAIDLVMKRTPMKFQVFVYIATNLLGTGAALLLSLAGLRALIHNYAVWTFGSIEMPVAPAWLAITIGSFVLALRLFVQTLEVANGDYSAIEDSEEIQLAEAEQGVV